MKNMKKKQKIVAILLAILTLFIIILLVSNNLSKNTKNKNTAANGVSIENITQNVEQWNIITAKWYNSVSKTIQEQNNKIKALEDKISKLEKK